MRTNWIYRRGDVYLADCGEWHGSVQGGIRPVLVLQNDVGNRYSPTLVVLRMTSKVGKKPNLPTHHLLQGVRGIPQDTIVLAEQPVTINKTDIVMYMAHLDAVRMDKIIRCVEIELGMVARWDDDMPTVGTSGNNAKLIAPAGKKQGAGTKHL